MNTSKPWLISVIIPVYNVAPYLIEALESVVHQTYQYLEIIIIDDGSTDGSGEICEEYAKKDKRIKIIHQENKGLSAARNTGLDTMNGQAIVFLDPDDAFCLQMIETMLNVMQDEEADMVVCKYISIITREHLKPEGKSRPSLLPGNYTCQEALQFVAEEKLNVSVWNKIYRSELWKDIRFPEGRVYEDWPVVFPVIERTNKVHILSDVLYMHRVHPGSISTTPGLMKNRDWIKNYSDFQSYVEQHTPTVFTTEQVQKTRERNVYRMLEQYVKCKPSKQHRNELRLLREQILDNTRGVLINRKKIWSAYQMFRFCPGLFRMLYRFVAVLRTGLLHTV